MRAFSQKWLPATLFAFMLTLALGACAGGGAVSEGGVRRASSRISAEELTAVAELDVRSAINRLRPSWLRQGTRGALPALIMDGTVQHAGLDMLSSLRATDVVALEFMSASDATTRYGTGYTSGAIVVTTRR